MALQIWLKDGHTTAVISRLAREFTRTTGIDLEVETVPEGSAHDLLVTGAKRPDVVTVPYWYLDEMVGNHVLRPLSSVNLAVEELGVFEPAAIGALTRAGELWAVPHTLTGGVLSYRRDLAREAGVDAPRTADELPAFVEALTPLVRHSFLARAGAEFSSAEAYLGWAWAHGVALMPRSGPVDLAQADEALNGLLHLLRTPSFTPLLDASYAALGEEMAQGNAAMLLDTSAWGFFLEAPGSPVAGKMGYTTVLGPSAPFQFLYAEGLGVTSWCADPLEAARFIRWRHSPEVVRAEGIELGRLDLPRRDLLEERWFQAEVGRRGLNEYLEVVWQAWRQVDTKHAVMRPDFVTSARDLMTRIRTVLRGESPTLVGTTVNQDRRK